MTQCKINIYLSSNNNLKSTNITMLTLFSKQITKAIDECKSSAVMAKKKWSIKRKKKIRAYQVTADEDDEYVSWGSDFDESCSDDGTEGRNSRSNNICDNINGDEVDEDEEEEVDDEDDDDQPASRCGSYLLNGTECHSSLQSRNMNDHSSTYDNTYEAISETPSTSSYGGSSENSSTFYETPPERRRGSCPSDTDKSSSGIGGMGDSTRSSSVDDRSDLSSLHCSVDGYSLDENKKQISHRAHQLSVEVTSEYIMRELNRKKRSLLNGCEASSEASSGQCSEPSPKPRIRPLVKPAIPPKPNIAQFNPSKPGSPGIRRKVRRKIVRPTGEPPPPPIPKSPPPISPASSKLSLTDRLAELTLDDLNEVLGVQLSSDPEDNEFGAADECKVVEGSESLSQPTSAKLTSANIAKLATTLTTQAPTTVTSNTNHSTSTTSSNLNQNDSQQKSIDNHNLNKSENANQKQLSDKMGLINAKIIKMNNDHRDHYKNTISKNKRNNYAVNSNQNGQSSVVSDVDCIVNDVDDDVDFGDYETPLNFKYPIAQNSNSLNSKKHTTGSNSVHSSSNSGSSMSPSTCTRMISRSSSVASGSYVPDSGFSDCTGISPYPISPPPPFDDNYCCSCRRLMKSVGSTPNLQTIRPSSRSELTLSPVTSTPPLSSLSSSSSMKNQSNTATSSETTAFNNNSHNSQSSHHHHQHQHHQHQHHHHHHSHQHSHSYSHSTSNLSLLAVDRPKLPRSKPDCGNSNSNNNSLSNGNHGNNNNNNNNNNNSNSSGISFKAEIAAKFAEKAAYARKIINSRPPFKTFESIYATGKSFGFSSSSSSNNSSSSVNHNNNINRSESTCNLAQRPLPPLPDDVMPIEKYSWFHGLERDSAALVLKNLGTEGAYLVRPSKRAGQANPLTLSILHQGKVFHLNVRRRSDGLYCLGKEKDKERTFASVPALIRFHQKEPILLTTKGESAGITKLMVTPISSSSLKPSSTS